MLNILLSKQTIQEYLDKYPYLRDFKDNQVVYRMIVEAEFRKRCVGWYSGCDDNKFVCRQCPWGVKLEDSKIWPTDSWFFKGRATYRIFRN